MIAARSTHGNWIAVNRLLTRAIKVSLGSIRRTAGGELSRDSEGAVRPEDEIRRVIVSHRVRHTEAGIFMNYYREHRAEFLETLKAFLRIPSISTLSEHKPDIQRAADFARSELANAGLTAELIGPLATPWSTR